MKIPALTDVSATLAGLQRRRAELLSQAHALRADLLALARSPDDDHPAGPVPAADVAALLGRVPPPRRASRVEQITELKQRIATLEAAADVLARDIEGEIGRASAIIRERLQPEHNRRLHALALAIVAAQLASAELSALEDALEAQGVRGVSSMSALDTRFLGAPRDPHGSANIWLREAVKEGALKERELPEGARHRGTDASFPQPEGGGQRAGTQPADRQGVEGARMKTLSTAHRAGRPPWPTSSLQPSRQATIAPR